MKRGIPCLAALTLASGLASGVSAQSLSFRTEATGLPFTELHSYAKGALGEDVLFFAGISGFGMHNLVAPPGVDTFALPAYNHDVHLLDQDDGQLYTGSLAHFTPAMREALRVTNPGFIQIGNTLHIYGGYGPLNSGTEWTTRDAVLSIDLVAVRDALKSAQPVPESAFSVAQSSAAKVAGGAIVKQGSTFALVGGSDFYGDYQDRDGPWSNTYSDSAQIFDPSVSMTTPVQTLFDPQSLHRRDLNVLPLTLDNGAGGTVDGWTIAGGVFNAVFPWENPVTFKAGDAAAAIDWGFEQKLNQYDAPNGVFYSASTGDNRIFILGGLSFYTWDGTDFINDFAVPWITEVSELTVGADGLFVPGSEKVIGTTVLPITNAHITLRPNMPVNSNGQILIDELPHFEHLLGRFFGGVAAVEPSNAPDTYASSTVYNVYVTVGLPGDIDKDGDVDFTDLNTLLAAYGSSGPNPADLNLDGNVGFTELNVVLANFGMMAGAD